MFVLAGVVFQLKRSGTICLFRGKIKPSLNHVCLGRDNFCWRARCNMPVQALSVRNNRAKWLFPVLCCVDESCLRKAEIRHNMSRILFQAKKKKRFKLFLKFKHKSWESHSMWLSIDHFDTVPLWWYKPQVSFLRHSLHFCRPQWLWLTWPSCLPACLL